MVYLVHSIGKAGCLLDSRQPKLEPPEVRRRHLNLFRRLKMSSFFCENGDVL